MPRLGRMCTRPDHRLARWSSSWSSTGVVCVEEACVCVCAVSGGAEGCSWNQFCSSVWSGCDVGVAVIEELGRGRGRDAASARHGRRGVGTVWTGWTVWTVLRSRPGGCVRVLRASLRRCTARWRSSVGDDGRSAGAVRCGCPRPRPPPPPPPPPTPLLLPDTAVVGRAFGASGAKPAAGGECAVVLDAANSSWSRCSSSRRMRRGDTGAGLAPRPLCRRAAACVGGRCNAPLCVGGRGRWGTSSVSHGLPDAFLLVCRERTGAPRGAGSGAWVSRSAPRGCG